MRARNLKPSLFVNELLASSDPHHTWIFTGLWCMADRRGILEDRPAVIHLTINPGRERQKTDASLAWLSTAGFIVRYTLSGFKCIKILAFSKHQNPHVKEKPSQLPDYNEAPDKPSSSTMPAPDQHHDGTMSALLIPSSLNPDPLLLIPDSPSASAPRHPPKSGTAKSGNGTHRIHRPRKTHDLPLPPGYPADTQLPIASTLAKLRARAKRPLE